MIGTKGSSYADVALLRCLLIWLMNSRIVAIWRGDRFSDHASKRLAAFSIWTRKYWFFHNGNNLSHPLKWRYRRAEDSL